MSDHATGDGVIVDGRYKVNETSVTLCKSTCFIGFGILYPEIDFVRAMIGPIFE
ncbi:hypothetical protein [Halocatena marina]|uniref:Uncharacterized protein n=1 Tax=Halocatena marina TaxID=2934937 RepID=A0ABD5YIF5_9EURY|nr:hypothetical protein [Halocatena marina]